MVLAPFLDVSGQDRVHASRKLKYLQRGERTAATQYKFNEINSLKTMDRFIYDTIGTVKG